MLSVVPQALLEKHLRVLHRHLTSDGFVDFARDIAGQADEDWGELGRLSGSSEHSLRAELFLFGKNPSSATRRDSGLIAALCAAPARGTPRRWPENCLKIEAATCCCGTRQSRNHASLFPCALA
jgi:hypothetical protein